MRSVGFAGGKHEAGICDLLPANKGRSSLVYKMIEAYGLIDKCIPITVNDAKRDDLIKFHDEDFVNILLKKRDGDGNKDESDDSDSDYNDELQESNELLEKYGLLYDCPVFPKMNKYIKIVSGSSLSSAKFLNKTSNQIAINWNGGRHHCKKSRASGFCYINDIVLSILELRKNFNKILYIDLDLHHGDGVETPFKFSNNVITLSIHRKEIGFFPGTGDLNDIGKGNGLNNCFNIPTKHGLNDNSMLKIITNIVLPIINKVQPNCLVIQCGCDGLNSDEHQEWNLTIKGFGEIIKILLNLNIKTLLLGGGGYDHNQVARLWTYLTSIALGLDIDFDILPDELTTDDYNDYEFWNIKSKNMIDENDDEYLDSMKEIVLNRLN